VTLLTDMIQEYGLNKFFTLTLDPENVIFDRETLEYMDPWDYIATPWDRMRKRLRRIDPDFKFVAILEEHKENKRPHIHGFTNLWLSQEEWVRHWEGSKGGRIVWVERVKDASVSSYVSKSIEVARYVGKGNIVGAYGKKKKCRTLWRSRGCKTKKELTSEPGWSIIKDPVYREDGNMTRYAKERFKNYGRETKSCRKDLA